MHAKKDERFAAVLDASSPENEKRKEGAPEYREALPYIISVLVACDINHGVAAAMHTHDDSHSDARKAIKSGQPALVTCTLAQP